MLQNKGVWLGYAEGDDLKGYVWGWRRFLRVVKILLKKGDLVK